jgi:hypothetical protein
MVHAPYVIHRFFSDILQKLLINGIESITKLKLTPKQDPALVSKIE